MDLRTEIISKILKIKKEEENFKTKWWDMRYYAELDKKSIHISDVNIQTLCDSDLLRLFEYVLLCREEVLEQRTRETYFS